MWITLWTLWKTKRFYIHRLWIMWITLWISVDNSVYNVDKLLKRCGKW